MGRGGRDKGGQDKDGKELESTVVVAPSANFVLEGKPEGVVLAVATLNDGEPSDYTQIPVGLNKN